MAYISPTWLKARELSVTCLTAVAAQRRVFGTLRCELCRNLVLITKQDPGDKTFGRICFIEQNLEGITPAAFLEIQDGTDGLFRQLRSNTIRVREGKYGKHPNFEYCWMADEADPTKGKLTYLRVDLTDDTFVNYISNKYRSGKRDLLKEMPESLDGLTEILGRPIPFGIDFEAKAEEILSGSGVPELAILIRATLAS